MRSAIMARCGASLEENIDEAKQTMAALDRSGISIDAVTAKLVEEGVQLFADAFDKLLGAVARKRAAHLGEKLDGQDLQAAGRARKAGRGLARSRGGTTAMCAGSGLATRAFGPAPTKRNGLAGSTSSSEQRKRIGVFRRLGRRYPTAGLLPHRPPRHGRIEPRAGGACRDVRTSRRPTRSFWCSTRPTRRRSEPSKARSIRPERFSSCRASPAARSSRIS